MKGEVIISMGIIWYTILIYDWACKRRPRRRSGDAMNGEVIISLNWVGRLRVLFTGKIKLSERIILYCPSEIQKMRYGDDE